MREGYGIGVVIGRVIGFVIGGFFRLIINGIRALINLFKK